MSSSPASTITSASQQETVNAAAATLKIAPTSLNFGTVYYDQIGVQFVTLTNTGSRGALFDTPIINQPQVAILATDGIARRPVVVTQPDGSESIAIHSTGILGVSWDHRAVDGAYVSLFLAKVSDLLGTRDWAAEL